MTVLTAAAVAFTIVSVAVAWGRRYMLASLGRLNDQLVQVDHQLQTWQQAHQHHAAELHRRLDGIERAANRAEVEARDVSGQLATLNTNGPSGNARS